MRTLTTMRERVEWYIATRRDRGCQMSVPSWGLRRFAQFADELGHRGPLTTELALRWARSGTQHSRLYQATKLEWVRGLARFLAPVEAGTEVPPTRFLGPAHRRTQPHIYTPQEIAGLLVAAATLPPRGGLRPRTYSTLIGLLACTGLRPGEAMRLDRDDLDTPAGLLKIRETKFGKSRLVPIHPSASRMLVGYAAFRDRQLAAVRCRRFFVTDRGMPLHPRVVCSTFRDLRQAAGLHDVGGPRAPRLYDFRHTFACRRLTTWYRQGRNVEQLIGHLATYLGHAQVTDTYWYLTGIPELLRIAACRFERFVASDSGGGS